MMSKQTRSWIFGLIIVSWCYGVAHSDAQHIGDILIGRDADNRLIAVNVPGEKEIECLAPVSPNPFVSGYQSTKTGFDHLGGLADPNDSFPLASGVDIYVKLIDAEPGFHVVRLSPLAHLDTPGEMLRLGGITQIHQHWSWNFNTNPALGPTIPDGFQGRMKATLSFVDQGSTDYAESEPFTMVFSIDPNSPADVNGNGVVSTPDAFALAARWLDEDCAHPDWCGRADINLDGRVDWIDYSWIIDFWLSTQGCP